MANQLLRFMLCGAVAAAVVAATPAAASDASSVLVSGEIGFEVGAVQATDRDVVELHTSTSRWLTTVDLDAVLPDGVDVDALSLVAGGDLVLSTATGFTAGGVTAADEDLLLYSGGVLSLLFDGSANGLPAAADIDAVHVTSMTQLSFYYSVETPTEIGGAVYTDDDILYFSGGSHALGLPGTALLGEEAKRADVDGLCVLAGPTRVLFTTDVSVADVFGVAAADDEDIIAFEVGVNSLLIDVSTTGLARAVDIDALHVVEAFFADNFESGNTTAWPNSNSGPARNAKAGNGGS